MLFIKRLCGVFARFWSSILGQYLFWANVSVVRADFNVLFAGRCGNDFKTIIFKLILQNSGLGTHFDIDFGSTLLNLTK